MRSKTKLASLTIAACLASACAHQSYQPKAIDTHQLADNFTARNLDSAELREYMASQGYTPEQFPIRTWGTRELTLAAFHFHPQLAVARAEWKAAQAQEITAGQKPNPSISSLVEHHGRTDGGISPWALGIGIDIPIETGGKRQARIDQAVRLSEAARLAIGQLAWDIRSGVCAALLEHQAATDKLALLSQEIALQQAIVQMLQKRLDAGLVSDVDLSVARLQLQRLQNLEGADRARITELRSQLALAIGLPPAALTHVQLETSSAATQPFDSPPPAEVQRTALLNRLDIRGALSQYAAAESRLRLEIARQQPDVVLSPGYLFDQGDNVWSLGISLLLNLTNKNEGPIAEANAQREVEARRFERLQARVISEQSMALAQYESRLAELAKAQAMVDAQKKNIARSERQLKAGYIDRLEWTTVQLEALTAEQGRLDASIRVQKALAALEEALQYPLDGTASLALPEQQSQDSPS